MKTIIAYHSRIGVILSDGSKRVIESQCSDFISMKSLLHGLGEHFEVNSLGQLVAAIGSGYHSLCVDDVAFEMRDSACNVQCTVSDIPYSGRYFDYKDWPI